MSDTTETQRRADWREAKSKGRTLGEVWDIYIALGKTDSERAQRKAEDDLSRMLVD